MIFRCRNVIPKLARNEWTAVEADSPNDAVQEFHVKRTGAPFSLVFFRDDEEGRREEIHFARIEVAGYKGSWVSRIFRSGLYRKGGVKPLETPAQKLTKLAEALLWKGDPKELIDEGWEGESSDWK